LFASRQLLVIGVLLLLSGCETDSSEPDSGSLIEPPPAGTGASTLVTDDGTASLPFGDSRIEFSVTDSGGDPMAGAAVSFSVGADVLLVGVDDPLTRFPPAFAVARLGDLNSSNAPALAASQHLTVVNTGLGSLSVTATVEPGAVEFRELSISSELFDAVAADEGLAGSCGLERDLDSAADGGSSSGAGIISLVALGREVAFTSAAPPDSAVGGLGLEFDLVGTDILQGCELLIGDSQSLLTAFAVQSSRFPGIYAHSGILKMGDPPSILYIVEVEPDGSDILVDTITRPGQLVYLSDITNNPETSIHSLMGLGGQGSRLLKISRRTGEAIVVGEFGFVGFNGLATAGHRRLLGAGRYGLSEINSGTGELKAKGEYGQDLASVGAIAFADGGTLFGILDNEINSGPDVHFLARIDSATSVATLVGELRIRTSGSTILDVGGLSFLAGELYGLTNAPGSLIRIDTLTALADVVRPLEFDALGAARPDRLNKSP
jgi:hypothetical protein